MREYTEVKKVEVELERRLSTVTCNKCGVSEDRSDGNCNSEYGDYYDTGYDDTFASFETNFGYGSRYDNEHWSFDLCEECLTELVKTFVVVPDGFGEDSYCVKYPQVMFDEWKETGQFDVEAGMTTEEIAENGGSVYGEETEDE